MKGKNLWIVLLVLVVILIGLYAYRAHVEATMPGATAPGTSTTLPASDGTSDSTATTPPADTTTPPGMQPGWQDGMQTITSADNGTTVHLQKNERFLIQLGSLDWTLAFNPATGITRVPNTLTTDGYQGVYEADQTGTTVLTATGRPICTAGEACPQFIQEVSVTFVVE